MINHRTQFNKGQIFVNVKSSSGQIITNQQPTTSLNKLSAYLPRNTIVT